MFLNPKLLRIILLLLFLSFLALSVFIAFHPITPLDINVSTAIQKYHSTLLDQLMLAISLFGEIPYSLLSVLLVAGIFYFHKFRIEAYFISLILFSGLIILLIKNLVSRPRPTSFYVRLVGVNRFESYPSGHVLSYILFFGFLVILMWKLPDIRNSIRKTVTYASVFLMISIAPSRIYLGAHWFTDTVGGFLLGLICLFPLCYYYFRQKKRLRTVDDKKNK